MSTIISVGWGAQYYETFLNLFFIKKKLKIFFYGSGTSIGILTYFVFKWAIPGSNLSISISKPLCHLCDAKYLQFVSRNMMQSYYSIHYRYRKCSLCLNKHLWLWIKIFLMLFTNLLWPMKQKRNGSMSNMTIKDVKIFSIREINRQHADMIVLTLYE